MKTPHIIAGPCSFESDNEMFKLAEQLSLLPNVKTFRAGIWKPRTLPGAFEGRGASALPALEAIQNKYNLEAAVEVSLPEHVEACMKYNIKKLWIGARSVCSPDLLEALFKKISERNPASTLLIKNPYACDLQLWIGATLRAQKHGLQVEHCFRGVKTEKPLFRNAPLWSWVREIKKQFPQTKMYLDPSHLYGKREVIMSEIKNFKRLDLFDAYMVETHLFPERALTDATQQLTPQELARFIAALHESYDKDAVDLLTLRKHIDHIDQCILEQFKLRQDISKQVAHSKRRSGHPVYDKKRFDELLSTRTLMAKKVGLSLSFTKEIFTKIHDESVSRQITELLQTRNNQRTGKIENEKDSKIQRI
ncbi:MAG: chorismate mutase [Bdellovibrionota bacterium]